MRPLFTPNFWGGFQILTQKLHDLLPQNLINKQHINFKLLSKFHVAKPNHSQVINKSLKLRKH